MLEKITIRTKIETEKDTLPAAHLATSVDNSQAPSGFDITQKFDDRLLFELSAGVNKENVTVWTIKNTITDFLFHLRTALKILDTISAFKGDQKTAKFKEKEEKKRGRC